MADWGKQPLSINLKELAEARAAIRSRRNAIIVVDPPKKLQDLEKAIRAGIYDCHQGLLKGYMRAVRVDAWKVMAKRIANPKDKQGWPRLFDGHVYVFDALTRLHAQIEFFNSSGGALRLAYGDFLEEASDVLGNPELKKISELFRNVATKWADLAKVALPDSVRLFKDARLAAEEWNNIFRTKGQSSPHQLEKTTEKIRFLRRQVIKSFPLTEAEMLNLLENLGTRLMEIHEREREAILALKSAVL